MLQLTEPRFTVSQVAQTVELSRSTLRLWNLAGMIPAENGEAEVSKVGRRSYSVLDVAHTAAVQTLSVHVGLADAIRIMLDVTTRFKSWPVAVELATKEVRNMWIFVRKYDGGIPDKYFFYSGDNFDVVRKLLDEETISMGIINVGKPISAALQRLPVDLQPYIEPT